jgi:isocitrate dehydrogenase
MLLDYLGWEESADLIRSALAETIAAGLVTYDLARQISGASELSCSEFGQAIRDRL